jgi:parallel beta-helix repeat protein
LGTRIDIGAFEFADVPINPMVVDNEFDVDDGIVSKGQVSLREAMRLGARMTIDPVLSGKTIHLTQGELVVDRIDTRIDGSALTERLTVDAGGNSFVLLVLYDASMSGLTFAGGSGAGIRVVGQGGHSSNLEIVNCGFERNVGAGISAGFPYSSIHVSDSLFRANQGSGISISGSPVSVFRSHFVDNLGDGISLSSTTSALIRNCTISGNTGAGIVVPNTGQAGNQPLITIERTTMASNGRGFSSSPSAYSNAKFFDCTIVDNAGAGIDAAHIGFLTITNSTVSNNHGRGVYVNGQTHTTVIRHSTITGNQGQRGAGLYSGERLVKVFNSIISGNTDSTGFEHDLYSRANLYFSILGRDNVANPQFPPQNIVGSIIGTNENPIDPLLGPLANNGGPTLTHMLLPGSIAIDAGDPALSAGQGTTPLFDQRGTGFSRIAAGRIDIGAIEAGSSPGNTTPVITTPSEVNSPENATAVLTLAVTDPDVPPQTLTYSISGGADAAKFQISSTGLLSFKVAPDFEVPDDAGENRVYDLTVRVDDSAGAFATKDLSITITPVNDNNPTFLSPAAISIPENVTLVMPVTAIDADLPGQAVAYSLVGGADQARFAITPGGVLSFVQAPDFEAPTDANGDNVYEVTVEASDGTGGATTQAISVTVTSSDPPPPVNADFNGDGFVTAGDLAIWRQNFGTIGGPDPTPGDADHDRDVDGRDFLIWQRTLGQVPPPAVAVRAEATDEESVASPGDVSFHMDADVLLLTPAVPGAPRVGDPPRRRPSFRPPGLPAMQVAPTEAGARALASPAAVDAAIAASSSLSPAVECAFDALLVGPLDDLFAAARDF